MSKAVSVGKELLKKCDLFASMQFLRFKSDAETKTLTGGFISLSVVIFLATQFTTMILDTFGKVVITSVTDSTQANQPPEIIYSTHENGKYFMLGFELWGYDLNTGPRYFDVTAVNAVLIQGLYSNQTVDIPLQPCTKQHWSGIKNIDVLFDRVGMGTWVCFPVNQSYVVSGNYISQIQRSIDITVSRCNNATDPTRPCATPAQIDAFLRSDSQFYWTPYFMNPLINPQNEQYLTYYLEDKWYVMSGFNYGSQMYIYNDDFQITTDQSIFPFEAEHFDQGPIVSAVFANAYDLDNTSDIYCLINFFRAPSSIIVKRQFQKVLDAFAYVGGLLGSFVLLLLVITFYNQGSYELNFASALYMPEEGAPNTFRGYNLFYYIIQGIYTVFRILGIRLKWKSVQFFYETRKEMLKQLDVMFLFKKIHILESAMKLMLTKPQLRGLMLQHEQNVTQARRIRKQYAIKVDVARLAIHKLEKNKNKDDQVSHGGSIGQIGGPQAELNETFKKKLVMGDDMKQTKKMSKSMEQENLQINIEDFGSDSQSSGAEDEHLRKQQELLDDLYQLQEDCMQNNEVSMKIFDSIDPRIKKILEKVTEIKFENSMKLSKMNKKAQKNNQNAQLDYSQNSLESPMFKRVKVASPDQRSRKLSSNKTSGRRRELQIGQNENLDKYQQLDKQDKKSDELSDKLEFDFNSFDP